MKKHTKDIMQEFDERHDLLHEFGEATNQLLKSLLTNYELKPHQLTYRIKNRDSLERKLQKKNFKYKSLNEITDLVGFRIVTYFEDDIDKIAQLIKNEFEIDDANSIDKRNLESDKFGYRSLHYVIGLRPERLKLTEYKKFKGLNAEVQVRSILQHSWAEIEHDLGYKGESEIPENAKRTFYRVAALLEQADIEFVKLRTLIIEHQQEIKAQIEINPNLVVLDKTSLLTFIKENSLLNETEIKIQKQSFKEERDSDPDFIISNALSRLNKLNIKTIKNLEDLYKKNTKNISEYIINRLPTYVVKDRQKPPRFVAGASILWLCGFLEEKNAS